ISARSVRLSIRPITGRSPTCDAPAPSRATLAADLRPISPTRWRTRLAPTSGFGKPIPPPPLNVASVRRFDQARLIGAKKLEQRPDESVGEPALLALLKTVGSAKSLK